MQATYSRDVIVISGSYVPWGVTASVVMCVPAQGIGVARHWVLLRICCVRGPGVARKKLEWPPDWRQGNSWFVEKEIVQWSSRSNLLSPPSVFCYVFSGTGLNFIGIRSEPCDQNAPCREKYLSVIVQQFWAVTRNYVLGRTYSHCIHLLNLCVQESQDMKVKRHFGQQSNKCYLLSTFTTSRLALALSGQKKKHLNVTSGWLLLILQTGFLRKWKKCCDVGCQSPLFRVNNDQRLMFCASATSQLLSEPLRFWWRYLNSKEEFSALCFVLQLHYRGVKVSFANCHVRRLGASSTDTGEPDFITATQRSCTESPRVHRSLCLAWTPGKRKNRRLRD